MQPLRKRLLHAVTRVNKLRTSSRVWSLVKSLCKPPRLLQSLAQVLASWQLLQVTVHSIAGVNAALDHLSDDGKQVGWKCPLWRRAAPESVPCKLLAVVVMNPSIHNTSNAMEQVVSRPRTSVQNVHIQHTSLKSVNKHSRKHTRVGCGGRGVRMVVYPPTLDSPRDVCLQSVLETRIHVVAVDASQGLGTYLPRRQHRTLE